MIIDVVPRYLSCTTKLLSKCTESLISSIHKALSQPQGTPAEGSCASRREKQLANPSKALVDSHFHTVCTLQTDVSWCSLWLKDGGQSQG